MRFTTKDKDNDVDKGKNCELAYKGGWWYNGCHSANPNGLYRGGGNAQGITWKTFRGRRIFFKAHRDQNSTSMISIEVVASPSQQQTVAPN